MRDSSPDQRQFSWSSRSEFDLTNAKPRNPETCARSDHGQFVFSRRNTTGFSEKFHSSATVDPHLNPLPPGEADAERLVRVKAHHNQQKFRIGVWVSRLHL